MQLQQRKEIKNERTIRREKNVLSKAGYDKSLKSLFIWEGVTMYLPGEAVRETLAFIDGKCDYYGAKELLASVSKTGEPYQFGIEEGKINSFLSENGFDVLSHYAPDEFEKSALYNDNGEFSGKMYGFACQVYARAKP